MIVALRRGIQGAVHPGDLGGGVDGAADGGVVHGQVPAGGRVTRPGAGAGLGWEECRAWTANPIQRTSQAQWVTMSLLRLLQFRLEACGEVGWWLRPPWNKKKDRPSVLDAERLMWRHREQIQRLLSKWARDEGNTRGNRGMSGV